MKIFHYLNLNIAGTYVIEVFNVTKIPIILLNYNFNSSSIRFNIQFNKMFLNFNELLKNFIWFFYRDEFFEKKKIKK